MYASTPKITDATALTHKGMEMPLIITSVQKMMRSRCANAINKKITNATIVKGFIFACFYPQ